MKRGHALFRAVVVLAAAPLAVLGLTSCGTDTFLPVTGTIYGTVTLPSGAPANGVRVIVEGSGLTARSGEDGRFVVNGVPSVRPGQIGEYYNLRGEYELDDIPHGFVKMHFKVKEQQSYSIGTVKVEEAGQIRGCVMLEGDEDWSGIRIRLDGLSLETLTNNKGNFLLERVPPYAHYEIICEHAGYAEVAVKDVAVGPGMDVEVPATELMRLP